MLNANYGDSLFDRLMYISDYVPGKNLERKTCSNPETEKPCYACFLCSETEKPCKQLTSVYSFPAEKEWQVILKG